ncbi:MAG: hydrogenobyrinic acid a,c-diamide synthase (glutamine-hydrolyzing) [Nitrospirota bacterium]|nr:hydrogenobyrinic acid a,c-diamide synthase (glutamine-hydrolyzing) [Nitrospirota bacterium]
MKSRYPRLIIAGLKGGAGKTTVSLGLISAWSESGLSVVPYKKGPDYIDAGWLSSAAERPCYNLDPFLIRKEKILDSFIGHFGNADCAVIEGNRGLYDGMDAAGTYSTAELAKMLKAPVLLVLDCTKVTRTAAAILMGMQKFDKKVDLKGVVLNQIAGARHEKVIRESIEKYCKIPVLGAIPKLGKDFLSERHMGLTPFQEHPGVKEALKAAREIIAEYLDLDGILKIARGAKSFDSGREGKAGKQREPALGRQMSSVRVGIIRDSAFQFYYPENFEELEKRGAELVEISAMKEKKLPDIDALYIGGGFPETNAISLARNTSFKRSLRRAVEEGLPVYAECGGLMYLGEALRLGGKKYSMAGIFPIEFCLEKKPQAHGYTIVETAAASPYYPEGILLKGHEFHYSRVISNERAGLSFSFRMKRGHGIIDKKDGLCYKNVLATYTHLHALGAPEWADGLIKQARSYKERFLRC